jgi:formate dehydrogenase maturation protein FdhE
MATEAKPLDQLLKELPAEAQEKVREVVEALLAKHEKASPRHLSQIWAGALQDFRHEFTSIELQKKSLDWRGD